MRLRVVDVEPPGPAKLADQVARVLALAEDVPPVLVEPELHDVRRLLPEPPPADVLLPCRAAGMELAGSEVSFLDERPDVRGWTLLGCFHPSQQNTFTGVLTEPMIDGVLLRARELAAL